MAPVTLPLRPLGQHTGIKASAQGFGAMQLPPAHFYSGGVNQTLIGKAIKGIPRDKIVITSKWGPRITASGFGSDYSAESCKELLDLSLQRLGVDYIDVLILRSKDKDTPIEDTVKIMAEHVKSGKIKGIGLSEIAPADVERAIKVHPVTCIEMEWSLFSRDAERDIVPVARKHGIAFLAYSPLGRGMLTGTIRSTSNIKDFCKMHPRFQGEALAKNYKLVEKLKAIADKKGCTAGQLALSWVHHQGEDVFPIPGTKTIKYLEENVAAFQIKLTKQELSEIEACFPEHEVIGDRYHLKHLQYQGSME
eukprot:jgi/Astpho2/6356/Aster-06019